MNHSCCPNVFWKYEKSDGKFRTLYARKNISIGEELCVCNIDEYRLVNCYEERQKFIQHSRQYKCLCQRCLYEYDDTRRIKCERCD
eukprot:UN34458